MTATVRSMIEDALFAAAEDGEIAPGTEWQSFVDAGVLAYDEGLVLRLPDGSEFQLTIVQSR